MGERLLDMLQESTLVQASIALVMIGTACYLYLVGRDVPETLVNLIALVLGFYFGTKTQQQAQALAKKIRKE